MQNYLSILKELQEKGRPKADRTGVGTKSLFGRQLHFDLSEGFPVLTTKRIHFPSVVTELLWFLNGDTNIGYLHEHKCTIWDEWATEEGDLGPMYGRQWRNWPKTGGGTVDQIKKLLSDLKTRPESRRLIISAWNPEFLPDESMSPQENVKSGRMALAPCHALIQFYVHDDRLSCLFYARSQDYFLGTPFNIASYALLTEIIAAHTYLKPGELVWTGGDVHLYNNHIEQADIQLARDPYHLPVLKFNKRDSIFDYEPGDFTLENYRHHPGIKAPVAV